MKVFEVVSEDLSGVGDPMGSSESTDENWRVLYTSLLSAKRHAERDYAKMFKMYNDPEDPDDEFIRWKGHGNRWESQDLRYVMYTIRAVAVLR